MIWFHPFFQEGFEGVDVGDECFTSALRDGKCRIRFTSDKLLAALKIAERFQTASVNSSSDFIVTKSTDSLAISTDMMPNRTLLSNALFRSSGIGFIGWG